MKIKDKIDELVREIVSDSERLSLYRRIDTAFSGVEFPEKLYMYAYRNGNGGIAVEFSPEYNTDDKDLQPFVHRLAQHFSVKFDRSLYSEDSLEYRAEFNIGNQVFIVKVTGVVPGSCRIEETVEQLSDEEIEEARAKALAEVKTTRTVRKIRCD
jgi:hypothetical protein